MSNKFYAIDNKNIYHRDLNLIYGQFPEYEYNDKINKLRIYDCDININNKLIYLPRNISNFINLKTIEFRNINLNINWDIIPKYIENIIIERCNIGNYYKINSNIELPTYLKSFKILHSNFTEKIKFILPNLLEELYFDDVKNYDHNPLILPDNLKSFTNINSLIYLSNLPNSLENLIYKNNYSLDEIPILPNSLKIIDISNNRIEYFLNDKLPNSLKILNCKNNKLKKLPSLPNSLEKLICSNNNLMEIPSLPSSLETLICSKNKLNELPNLSRTSLKDLCCKYNKLIEIPILPNSLINLYCQNNKLTKITNFPNSLGYLHCQNNKLTSIPNLPNSLIKLYCQNNNINIIENLPDNLKILYCYNNPLEYIPILPDLIELRFFGKVKYISINHGTIFKENSSFSIKIDNYPHIINCQSSYDDYVKYKSNWIKSAKR